MLNKILMMAAVLLAGAVIAALAWPSRPPSSAQPAEPPFRPQAIPLDAELVSPGADAWQLLDKAIERIVPERAPWLLTKIRQTMSDHRCSFVAEGFLQRGPMHCARLELDIVANHHASKLLMVSDGKLLATVKSFPGRPPIEQIVHLVPEDDPAPPPIDLNSKGCGGPVALLEQLRQRLQNARVQTGLLHGVAVVRIKGELHGEQVPGFGSLATPVRSASIYLDAQTLWPAQLEWWGAEKRVLQIEFPDPVLNRPLSVSDCEKMFSYRPEGNVGIVEPE